MWAPILGSKPLVLFEMPKTATWSNLSPSLVVDLKTILKYHGPMMDSLCWLGLTWYTASPLFFFFFFNCGQLNWNLNQRITLEPQTWLWNQFWTVDLSRISRYVEKVENLDLHHGLLWAYRWRSEPLILFGSLKMIMVECHPLIRHRSGEVNEEMLHVNLLSVKWLGFTW